MQRIQRTDPLDVSLARYLVISAFLLVVAGGGKALAQKNYRLEKTSFSALKGWKKDAHAQAFSAYLKSCTRLLGSGDIRQTRPNRKKSGKKHYLKACRKAQRLGPNPDDKQARKFFEKNFRPYRILWKGSPKGLFTGYYEPEYKGSRQKSKTYFVPVLGAPDNLVSLTNAKKPKGFPRKLTAALQHGRNFKPLPSRAGIENGALAKSTQALVWLADPVDAFFLHIQGSGRITLHEGGSMRLGFAGRNGHPYSSIGKALLKKGILKANELSMKSVQNWLRTHPKKARKILQANKSYIFFRELDLDANLGPIGGEGVPLTARRSLAIDRRYHAYGLPLWVDTRIPGEGGKTHTPFRHLLIAQDTGAAIKGAIRGDIFFGTGKKAGETAGRVKESGHMFVLVPKNKNTPKKKEKKKDK